MARHRPTSQEFQRDNRSCLSPKSQSHRQVAPGFWFGLQVCQNVNVGSDVKLKPLSSPRLPPLGSLGLFRPFLSTFWAFNLLRCFLFQRCFSNWKSRLPFVLQCYFNQNPVQTILAIIFSRSWFLPWQLYILYIGDWDVVCWRSSNWAHALCQSTQKRKKNDGGMTPHQLFLLKTTTNSAVDVNVWWIYFVFFQRCFCLLVNPGRREKPLSRYVFYFNNL